MVVYVHPNGRRGEAWPGVSRAGGQVGRTDCADGKAAHSSICPGLCQAGYDAAVQLIFRVSFSLFGWIISGRQPRKGRVVS